MEKMKSGEDPSLLSCATALKHTSGLLLRVVSSGLLGSTMFLAQQAPGWVGGGRGPRAVKTHKTGATAASVSILGSEWMMSPPAAVEKRSHESSMNRRPRPLR